jgi:hypothetical protein
MSIIQTKKEYTREEKLEQIKNRIIASNTSNYSALKIWVRDGFNKVWKDKEFTAQEICDTFGTSALDLFNSHSKAQDLLQAVDPTYVRLTPPKEVEFEIVNGAPTGKVIIHEQK